MNHVIRVVIVVALCAALAALTLALSRQTASSEEEAFAPEQLRSGFEMRRAPERYLANVVDATQGPLLELERGKSRFRLISFLHLDDPPSQSDYDPGRRYTYGLTLRVRDERDAIIHEEKVWFETRKSKSFGEAEQVRDSSALYITPGQEGEPADQRMFDVDLESWAGPGRALEVLALSGGTASDVQVNLVAFWRVQRSDERVAWRQRTLDTEDRAIIASRSGLRAWSRLRDDELESALRHTYVRQTSQRDTLMRQVLSTDYRRAPLTEPTEGVLVAPNAPVVFNLEGPVTLSTLGLGGTGDVNVNAEVMQFGERVSWRINESSVPSLNVKQEQKDKSPLSAQASPLVALTAGQSATVAIWPTGGATAMMFFVDRVEGLLGEHSPGKLADGSIAALPDRKKIRLFTLAPKPIHYMLRHGPGGVLGEGLMVTLRVARGSGPVTVTYGFPELGFSQPLTLEGVPNAPLERLVWSDDSEAQVSEARTYKLWLPPGAERLSLQSDQPGRVAASVSVVEFDEGEGLAYRPPYSEQLDADQQTWRYAPLANAPWLTIAPQEAQSLMADMRQVMLLAQVRRMWSGRALQALALSDTMKAPTSGVLQRSVIAGPDDSDEDERRVVSIEPSRAWREELVWDMMPGVWLRSTTALARYRERWTEYDAIGFPPHHAWRCELPSVIAPSKRLEMQYSVPQPGGAMTLSFAGEPRRRQLTRTRSTTETLWTQGWPERGELLLELQTPDGAQVDELARTNCFPTGPDARLSHWRSRRVHGLAMNRDIVIKVRADEQGTWNLNMVAYMDSPSAEIEVQVDGGEPERSMMVVPEFTRASRTLALQAGRKQRVPFARSAHLSVYGPVKVSVPIGSDLAPGEHEVRIIWRGGRDERAWLRFFRMK